MERETRRAPGLAGGRERDVMRARGERSTVVARRALHASGGIWVRGTARCGSPYTAAGTTVMVAETTRRIHKHRTLGFLMEHYRDTVSWTITLLVYSSNVFITWTNIFETQSNVFIP